MSALIKATDLAQELFSQGLEPGSVIQSSKLEELTGLNRRDASFGFFVSQLRRKIAKYGLYLSGEGHDGNAFEILHPRDNQWVAKLSRAKAQRDRKFMETLLTNTNREMLSDLERKRHEAELKTTRLELQLFKRNNRAKLRELIEE